MKLLIAFISIFTTIMILGENFEGNWELQTLNGNKDVYIKRDKNKLNIYRKIVQNFDGEKYVLQHLIVGDFDKKGIKTNFKLYVKDNELPEFEYLRAMPLIWVDNNLLNIDGVDLKRKNPVKGIKKVDNTKKDDSNSENEIEIVIIKKDKNKNSDNRSVVAKKDDNKMLEMLPGLGEAMSENIKISKGFSSNEELLYKKGVRLKKRKRYKQALNIFLSIYEKNSKNVSVLADIINVYKKLNNQKKIKFYCKKIKRYDPFFRCK